MCIPSWFHSKMHLAIATIWTWNCADTWHQHVPAMTSVTAQHLNWWDVFQFRKFSSLTIWWRICFIDSHILKFVTELSQRNYISILSVTKIPSHNRFKCKSVLIIQCDSENPIYYFAHSHKMTLLIREPNVASGGIETKLCVFFISSASVASSCSLFLLPQCSYVVWCWINTLLCTQAINKLCVAIILFFSVVAAGSFHSVCFVYVILF